MTSEVHVIEGDIIIRGRLAALLKFAAELEGNGIKDMLEAWTQAALEGDHAIKAG